MSAHSHTLPSRESPSLGPAARRASVSIVRAALRLIAANGTMPTTREIAEEVKIAEGTIFRAFDTKERLVEASSGRRSVPLRSRCRCRRSTWTSRSGSGWSPSSPSSRAAHRIFRAVSALGLTAPPTDYEEHRGCRPDIGHVPVEEQDPADDTAWHGRHRLLAFVEPDADQLSCTPAELVRYLRLFTFSASHPDIAEGQILPPQTIVAVVLDGVSRKAS